MHPLSTLVTLPPAWLVVKESWFLQIAIVCRDMVRGRSCAPTRWSQNQEGVIRSATGLSAQQLQGMERLNS